MTILKVLSAALPTAFATPALAQPGQSLPHILVYKTNADYSQLVQVEMSADKSRIIAYPAPVDVTGVIAPVKLIRGYWLSKTGISERTAFLNINREIYAQRTESPDEAELMRVIRDKFPLEELWDCGERGQLSEKAINKLIKRKRLSTKCKRLK